MESQPLVESRESKSMPFDVQSSFNNGLFGEIRVSRVSARNSVNKWIRGATWRNSAMCKNEWAALPLPVLDVLSQHLLSSHFRDMLNAATVCKSWCVALTQKLPLAMQVFADNGHALEKRRQREREKLQFHNSIARSARKDKVLFNGAVLCLISLLALMFLSLGVTGAAFFPQLIRSVSTVPACPSASAMAASLYCSCAFWIIVALLCFLWYLLTLSPLLPLCGRSSLPPGPTFTVLDVFGIAATVGIWTSAAACVHFCNACTDVNPLVAPQVRAFAGTSLALGLCLNAACIFLQFPLQRR